eukprot:2979200-Amphidinium_carterae.1
MTASKHESQKLQKCHKNVVSSPHCSSLGCASWHTLDSRFCGFMKLLGEVPRDSVCPTLAKDDVPQDGALACIE